MSSFLRQSPQLFPSTRTFQRLNRAERLARTDVPSAIPSFTRTESAPLSVVHREGQWCFIFLWLLTFVIYARPEDMFPVVAPLHLTFFFASCATLLGATAVIVGSARLPWAIETKLVLLLSCWFVAGVPFAFWRSGSLDILSHVWAKTVLVFLLLTLTLVTLERIYALLWAIILSEFLATAFSIFQPSKALWVGERIYGANIGFLGWNFLGIAAAMTIPYIAAIFVTRHSLLSTCLLIGTSLSMMWMLVLTASRGGFLNVVVSVVLTSCLVLRENYRGKLAGLGIAAALLIATTLAPPVFWDRLGTIWNRPDASPYTEQFRSGLEQLAAQESTEGRLELLNRSVQYTLEHPLFGLGLGNFNLVSGAQHSAEPNAWMGTHNTFTQISSEAGLPALTLYVMLLAAMVRSMNRIRRAALKDVNGSELRLMASATLASLLSFTFGACVAHLGYDYYFFYIVAIACCLGCIARERTTTAEDDRATHLQMSTA
jgi:O-antigen ligase